MLEFREINISDKIRINNSLSKSDFMGCEYSFANNLAWRRLNNSLVSFYKDFYICASFGDGTTPPCYIFPAGNGDYREVITELRRNSENLGFPLTMFGFTDKTLPLLEEFFPGQYTAELDRDSSDYIYLRSDLIELAGKKYHAKRNHLSRFNDIKYEYSSINESDFDDCILFATEHYNASDKSDHSILAEQFAINSFFNYYTELDLKGGIVRIDGKICAMTIGEHLNSDTFCVHIEKADTSYNGIYAGINNLFVRSDATKGHLYINREEDLGIEGLRKAKLSYYPAFILNKYYVVFK